VTDANGVSLELCLTGPGTATGAAGPPPDYCFYDPIMAGNAYSARVGFGAEAFWWLAGADFDTPYGNRLGNFKPTIDMAIEAAWATEEPGAGLNFPFTRLRIRFFPPAAGTYTITHPYGVEVFVAGAADVNERANIVYDIPFDPMQTHVGKLGTVLRWDADAPAGYLGNGEASHTVTGSPCNFNRVRFQAVDPNGQPIDLLTDAGVQNQIETDLFTVMGKTATRAGVSVARASYAKTSVDPGIEVFAASKPAQTISFTVNGGTTPTTLVEDASVPGRYFGFLPTVPFLPASGYPPALAIKNETDGAEVNPAFPESLVTLVAKDAVTITTAYYYRTDQKLQIQAKSTDPSGPTECPGGSPRMRVTGPDGLPVGPSNGVFPPRTPSGYNLIITNMPVPPPSITVTSCFGGSSTVPIDVGAPCTAGALCKAK
jgi:hypothetical protein